MAMQRKRRRRSGRNNNNNFNPNRHNESNGPDVRIRGSAQQILEKYMQYARDAQTSGDRVKAEALFQHAEHYARIVAEFDRLKEEARQEREARDAARADERAQKDAEREARAEDEDGDDDDAETASESSDTDEKPRRRGRKPKSDVASDAMKVIDDEDGHQAQSSDSEDEKPRRRRTYTRKKDAEDDGVMKTLARGADEVVAEAD